MAIRSRSGEQRERARGHEAHTKGGGHDEAVVGFVLGGHGDTSDITHRIADELHAIDWSHRCGVDLGQRRSIAHTVGGRNLGGQHTRCVEHTGSKTASGRLGIERTVEG